jgi:hypothetical protein
MKARVLNIRFAEKYFECEHLGMPHIFKTSKCGTFYAFPHATNWTKHNSKEFSTELIAGGWRQIPYEIAKKKLNFS